MARNCIQVDANSLATHAFVYRKAENIGGIKHRRIRLFGGEKLGEWPNNGKWILKIP